MPLSSSFSSSSSSSPSYSAATTRQKFELGPQNDCLLAVCRSYLILYTHTSMYTYLYLYVISSLIKREIVWEILVVR